MCDERAMLMRPNSNPVARAVWYVESHLADEVALADIAEAAGISRFHLSRSFGMATGHSLGAYLRRRRLAEAAKLLAAGAPDILSVALGAGYGSHEAFTRAFRDLFGLTPEQVRAARSTEKLDLVEAISMNDRPAFPLAAPRYETRPAMTIAGLAASYGYEDMGGIPGQWRSFQPYIGSIAGEVEGIAYGAICERTDGEEGMLYLAGVEVREGAGLPKELTAVRVPAQRYAIFLHDGHVSGVGALFGAIWGEWAPAASPGPKKGAVSALEVYGPRFDPETGLGGVEVWVPVGD